MTNQQFTNMIIKKYSRESVMAQREMAQLRAMFQPTPKPSIKCTFSLTRKEKFYAILCALIVAVMAFSSGTSKADAGAQFGGDNAICQDGDCYTFGYVVQETPSHDVACYGDKVDTIDSVYSDVILVNALWNETTTSVLVPMPKFWASVTVCR